MKFIKRAVYVVSGSAIIVGTGVACSSLMNDYHWPWAAVPLFVLMGCTGLYMVFCGLLD